jgi:hypothetical protein
VADLAVVHVADALGLYARYTRDGGLKQLLEGAGQEAADASPTELEGTEARRAR